MKQNIFNFSFCASLLVASLVFISCSKKDIADREGTRLSRIIRSDLDSVAIISFHYDQNDKLTSIDQTLNNKATYRTSVLYDNNGHLLQSQQLYIPANSSVVAKYFYSNEQIISKVVTDDLGNRITNNYAYNSQGKLISDTLHDSNDRNYSYTNYKYTGENIQEAEYFYNYAGSWQKTGTDRAMYTAAANPFTSIGLMYYITLPGDDGNNFSPINQNLVSQLINGLGVVQYSYEYYSNGLPGKVQISYSYDTTKHSVLEFFYE